MPRSMTGFGQADENGYHVEIKGVNHRYRDIRVRLPRNLTAIEIPIRDMIQEEILRGKIDIIVTRSTLSAAQARMTINWEQASLYYEDMKQLAEHFGGEVNFRDIILIPGVMTESNQDVEEQWPLIQDPIKKALDTLLTTKHNEGKRLKADIISRLDSLLEMHARMKAQAQDMVAIYRERLMSHLNDLIAEKADMIDEIRLEQEVALVTDKSDITEEFVRLESHITSFKEVIDFPGKSIGRRLDFMLQEINRELNTIGSKSQISSLSHIVIDAKTEVEKIREQVQNIE